VVADKQLEKRLYEAEIQKNLAEAQLYEQQLKEYVYEHRRRLAGRDERRVYDFASSVDGYSISLAVQDLNDWADYSSEPILIRLNSPGGSIMDGFMLFDFIRLLREQRGIEVNVMCLGMAASMGSILLQAGARRYIGKNSWFMVHEPSSLAYGGASVVHDEASLLKRLHRQLCGILAERSTLTLRQILAKCERKDWWMTASEAVEFGFADEVV
jgi:ATP-dependent Clp endopeptidase proteolytic subunit ClpP